MLSARSNLLLLIATVVIISGLIINDQFNLIATLNPLVIKKPVIDKIDIPAPVVNSLFYITGKNFSPNPAKNIVKIYNQNLTVKSAFDTSLQIVLPPIAFTGPLTVTVDGQESEAKIIELPGPRLDYLEFPEGLKPGAPIIINGLNFSATESRVYFGQKILEIKNKSNLKNSQNWIFTAILPHEAISGPVTVTNNEFISNPINLTLAVTPIIKNITLEKNVIGDKVTISGDYFSPEINKNIIRFNNLTGEIINASQHEIISKIPPLADSGFITVTVNNYTSNQKSYTLANGPSITYGGLEKDLSQGLARIILYSPEFTDSAAKPDIYLEPNIKLTVDSFFQNRAKAILPRSLAISGLISARLNGLKGNQITVNFQKELAPAITNIETDKGFFPGQKFTIIGANFDPIFKTVNIPNIIIESVSEFGLEARLSGNVESDTSLRLQFSNFGLSSNSLNLTVGDDRKKIYRPPEINKIIFEKGNNPASLITIQGIGFSEDKKDNLVNLMNEPVKITFASFNELTASLPQTAKSGNLTVTVDKTVSNAYFVNIFAPEDKIKSLSWQKIDPIKLSNRNNSTLGQLNIINHDRNIIIKKLTLKFEIDKAKSFALSSLRLANGSYLSPIKNLETKGSEYFVTYENLPVPATDQAQTWTLTADILPIFDNLDYAINLNQNSENLTSVYEVNQQSVNFAVSGDSLLKNQIIFDSPKCVTSSFKDYCQVAAPAIPASPKIKEENPAPVISTPIPVTAPPTNQNPVSSLPTENLESVPFSDVPTNSWFNIAVASLKSKKIIGGYSDGRFQPDKPVTRAEFLKITLLAGGINISSNEPKQNQFSDTAGHWAGAYINYAASHNLIDGSRPFFNPDKPISRAEAIKILTTAFNLGLENPEAYQFVDTKNHWCQRWCDAGKRLNIISGYQLPEGNFFYPEKFLNRAEASQLVYKTNLSFPRRP